MHTTRAHAFDGQPLLSDSATEVIHQNRIAGAVGVRLELQSRVRHEIHSSH